MSILTIRYKHIKNLVNDLYIKFNIYRFPIDIKEIISSFDNIKIVSYHQFMLKYNLTKEETFELLSSEEGCTDYCKSLNRYIIYYNDLYYKSEERIKWTITHELGHILCEHYCNKTRLFCEDLTENEYKFREAEANHFTGLLLSNPIILDMLNVKSAYDIEIYCALSSEAARYRYDNYKKWRKNKFISSSDRCIIRNFKNYIAEQQQNYQEFIGFMNSFR
ncbi:ImmA/IrrE family metallo-endopeptidase [Clostridium sp.]|uniref:ImmA/IrrE family metallo-endopeptidase n=1 Tax=Clostridium sp. TaxID=1506 RepID=UPI00262EFD2F|nr:ImmA/IrrE family metallo-endopeptidase [Clostridium sp.]